MNRILKKLFWAMVFMVIAVLLHGCEQGQFRPFRKAPAPPTDQISKEELREALDNYEEFFIATVKNVSDQLDELMPNTRNYKSTLHLRDHTISACRTMLEQDDPQVAFVDSWVLAVRLAEYFKSGHGSELFGKYQSLAVNAAGQIQEHIERIGKVFLDTKTFIITQNKVYEFSRTHPIGKKYAESIVFATEAKDGQPSLFDDVINISLVPFKAVEGVPGRVVGTHKLSESADHFSDIVESLPESARWQLLLLLYDMEKTDMVKSALANMNEFAESSSRFANSAEKLPEQLRQQISILIEEIDAKQENIRATLKTAQETAAAMNLTMAETNKAADSIDRTAKSVAETARAWDSAAKTIGEVVKGFTREKPPKTEAGPPFNINDYRATAETVSQTVSKMQELTVEVHKLIESEQLSQYISVPRKITNILAWRIAQLVTLIFLLALAYRLVTVRFINKPK